ncbi:prepilin-type N-terminal cleavage/methylation domain-containing protein [bacterium]|nr:prepilin-type N-terminal cleavage/methylation domain-containing protein [bacterium]
MRNSFIKRGFRGVTLLEILVSVAVLAVGLGIAFQVFPMGFAVSAKSKNLSLAYELAAKRLEEARGRVLFGGNRANTSITNGERSFYGNLRAPNPEAAGETAYSQVNTNGQWIPCGTTGTPEAFYYYKVDCIPVIDTRGLYAEFPHYYKDDNSFRPDTMAGTAPWTDNAYNSGNVLADGFASMYRITVTVRGPFPPPTNGLNANALAAQSNRASDTVFNTLDDTSKHALSEAVLSTIVANSRLGDGLLAKEITLRYPNSVKSHVSGLGQRYPVTNGLVNNVIYVKGYGGTGASLRAENFTLLFTPNLTSMELDDTGPTIVSSAVAAGGTLTSLEQLVDRSTGIDEKYKANAHYKSLFGSNLTSSAKSVALMDGTYCGTNLYNMDNIVIFCPTYAKSYAHNSCTFNNGGWVAESNKLWRMTPPNAAGNTESYWKFELVNELFGRDGDYTTGVNKNSGYGNGTVSREGYLMDKVFDGDILLSSGYIGYPVGSGSGSGITGTRVRSLVTIESGLKSSTVYQEDPTTGLPTAVSGAASNY